MRNYDRAAQFSQFQALSGFEEEVMEVSRKTEELIELDEDAKEILNAKLQIILEKLNNSIYPEIKITFFEQDFKKDGGMYKSFLGKIKKIDYDHNEIKTFNETIIPINYLYDLEGEIFRNMEW